MSPDNICASQILKMRICFALRRATGVVFDVEAMLSRPHLLSKRLEIWRSVGCDELNSLLDQYESELGEHDGDDLHHAPLAAVHAGAGSCSPS